MLITGEKEKRKKRFKKLIGASEKERWRENELLVSEVIERRRKKDRKIERKKEKRKKEKKWFKNIIIHCITEKGAT